MRNAYTLYSTFRNLAKAKRETRDIGESIYAENEEVLEMK